MLEFYIFTCTIAVAKKYSKKILKKNIQKKIFKKNIKKNIKTNIKVIQTISTINQSLLINTRFLRRLNCTYEKNHVILL
jgi:hypothetical protein